MQSDLLHIPSHTTTFPLHKDYFTINHEKTVALGQKALLRPSHKDHKVDVYSHHYEIAALRHTYLIRPSYKDQKVDVYPTIKKVTQIYTKLAAIKN